VLECVGSVQTLTTSFAAVRDEGRIEPGRVFDRTVGLDGVPDGYRAMAGRQSLKVLIAP